MSYTVKEVSKITGITVRALHHYDNIGLICPEQRTESGYRIYSDKDLESLYKILFFRELDFSLNEIKLMINNPKFNNKSLFIEHKKLLEEKRNRLNNILISVDEYIKNINKEKTMTNKNFQAFDDSKIEEYKKEAKQRWPKTYAESEAKTSKYTKEDWDRIKAEAGEIYNGIANNMDKGISSEEVQNATDRFYKHLNQFFYTCNPEMFKGLGEMYVADERFTAFFENIKPNVGMAQFMRDAMAYYADNLK